MSMSYLGVFGDSNQKYAEYLISPEWKAKRKAVKERCKNICERCRKYLLDEVHHLTYKRIFKEPLEDLQGLCKPCHRFLHGKSGIDPLAKNIFIKVAFKVIEYWDSKGEKFRRVRIDRLPPENFGWRRLCTSDGKILAAFHEKIGEYLVPMEVFLDAHGNPIFNPSKWEKYNIAFGFGGRPAPDPETTKAFQRHNHEAEKRKKAESQRLKNHPEYFTSYRSDLHRPAQEVMALFRKYPRILDNRNGEECKILSVRITKRRGVVLDLHVDIPEGWARYKVYHTERKLSTGEILFDTARQLWVLIGPHFGGLGKRKGPWGVGG